MCEATPWYGAMDILVAKYMWTLRIKISAKANLTAVVRYGGESEQVRSEHGTKPAEGR